MTSSIATPLTRRLGIVHPVLLAPMGGVAGGRLAAAVSDAGGLGLIGGGYADPGALRCELAEAGAARIGVGFITFALRERPQSLAIALEHRPVAVQLSFGDPAPFSDEIHAAGALLISQVQTVAEARRAVEAGADIVIAQGQDSGGHGRPGRGTISLVPAIVDAVGPIPVVAAGGIGDGRGLAAALMLGAAGVTLGTRLYASIESTSDASADQLLVSSSGDDTVRTTAFDVIRGPAWPSGYDGRVVANPFVDSWDERGATPHPALEATYRGAAEDDYTVQPLWAGDGLDLIHGIEPAGAIVAGIVAGAVSLLNAAATVLRG